MDDYEFSTFSDFPGYNSSRDASNIAGPFLVRGSKNVYKKNSGTLAARCGLKRRGTADATLAPVVGSYEWPASLGVTRVLRVDNNKLQIEWNGVDGSTYVWYDLVETGTLASPAVTLTRFVFDSWWDNTEKKDRTVFVRGDSNILHWSGGIATVASGTGNTITKLDSTKTWAQEGFATNTVGEKKVVINGVEYTYTGGESTQVLTGVTPDASALASGQVAVQSVIVEANKPVAGFKADFLKVIGNRVHYGSYTSRLVYIAKNTAFNYFTIPTPRASGDAELLTLDNNVRGITVRMGNAHITAGTQDWYEVIYTDLAVADGTGGSINTQQTKVDKKPTANLAAALAHEFIDTVGDDIIYLSQDQQLRQLGTFRNVLHPKYPSLSQDILDELTQETFTGGHLRAIGDYVFLTAPVNGRVYLRQTRENVDMNGNVVAERFWNAPQVMNVSRIALIDGIVYGHSNANPQLYQIFDTGQWHDDSPTDEPLAYSCVARFAYEQLHTKSSARRRQGLLKFDKIYTEGYMTSGTNLYCNAYYDYQGASSIVSATINDGTALAKTFSGSAAPSMGGSSLGDNPLGDGLTPEANDQALVPKWRAINLVNVTNCFEYALEVCSIDADSRWELLAIGTNLSQSEQRPTFITK